MLANKNTTFTYNLNTFNEAQVLAKHNQWGKALDTMILSIESIPDTPYKSQDAFFWMMQRAIEQVGRDSEQGCQAQAILGSIYA